MANITSLAGQKVTVLAEYNRCSPHLNPLERKIANKNTVKGAN